MWVRAADSLLLAAGWLRRRWLPYRAIRQKQVLPTFCNVWLHVTVTHGHSATQPLVAYWRFVAQPSRLQVCDCDCVNEDGVDGLRAELIAIADEWARAIVSNDAELIAGFIAPEWVIVSESGMSPKEAFLSLVASGELTHSAMDRVGEPLVRVYGETAVVTARVTNTAHYGGDRFDADEWTTDVFVRRDGVWRCVLTHLAAAAPEVR